MSSAVPVIDFTLGATVPLQSVWNITDDQRYLARLLVNAFKEVGFVCLTNTNLDEAKINNLVSSAKEFFQKDHAYKEKFNKGVMGNVGWTDVGRENLNPQIRTGDYKETFNFQPFMLSSELPDSMVTLKGWWEMGSELALQVMKLIGLGLGLDDPSVIADSHSFGSKKNDSAIRVNFYPATAEQKLEPTQVRCGEHTDYGSVTLLVQDSQGLQVMNRQTNQYEAVIAPPGGVVVNIGDALQFWTSDILHANKHRVLIPEDKGLQSQDRVSIPFFSMPDKATTIRCLLGQNKYEPVVMAEWLKMKIDSSFSKERMS